jgi:transposase-like protein
VRALLASVYDQPDVVSLHARFDCVLAILTDELPASPGTWRRRSPHVHRVPREICRQIWSNNPSERLRDSTMSVLVGIGLGRVS